MTDTETTIDVEAFIDGYITCALWVDCYPAEPTDDDLAEFAWQEGATAEYLARTSPGKLAADWRDRLMDSAESGGCEGLEIRLAARERMAGDCRDFIDANRADLASYCEIMGPWSGTDSRGYIDREPAEARAGHDFWLTRGGHGTGFWDRGLGELGDRLSDAAQAYGEPCNMTPIDMGDGTADTIGT